MEYTMINSTKTCVEIRLGKPISRNAKLAVLVFIAALFISIAIAHAMREAAALSPNGTWFLNQICPQTFHKMTAEGREKHLNFYSECMAEDRNRK
jgi:hypothetical protein